MTPAPWQSVILRVAAGVTLACTPSGLPPPSAPTSMNRHDLAPDETGMADVDRVWNRAVLRSGGPNPREGDRALAALMRAHGMVMNGGVNHALEGLSSAEQSAAAAGFLLFSFSDVADLFAKAATGSRNIDTSDDRYWRSVPDDGAITSRFRDLFARSPELFAPL
jgi:hypothetical protein